MKPKQCILCGGTLTTIRKPQPDEPEGELHMFCLSCKGHYYRDHWWTKKEWERWVNYED